MEYFADLKESDIYLIGSDLKVFTDVKCQDMYRVFHDNRPKMISFRTIVTLRCHLKTSGEPPEDLKNL